MIPGDGVGPELMNSVKTVFKAANVPVEFEELNLSEISQLDDETHFQNAVDSIRRNGVCLMGHITAGQMEGVTQDRVFSTVIAIDQFAILVILTHLHDSFTKSLFSQPPSNFVLHWMSMPMFAVSRTLKV